MDGVTSYRVMDLELYAAGDLTPLAAALEARGLNVGHRALWRGEAEWYWRFQVTSEEPYGDPEPEVVAALAAVEALAPPARAAWDGCSRRVFDLAYDCGASPFVVRHDLSARTLARLAAVGGVLRITLYALDPSEVKPAAPGPSPQA